jgi:hypothetical protein
VSEAAAAEGEQLVVGPGFDRRVVLVVIVVQRL